MQVFKIAPVMHNLLIKSYIHYSISELTVGFLCGYFFSCEVIEEAAPCPFLGIYAQRK